MRAIETWREVPSEPRLSVSSIGRVMTNPFSVPAQGCRVYGGKPTRGSIRNGRYSHRAGNQYYYVSRLVCEAFNGPPPFVGAFVLHVDECEKNNDPNNLVWGTQRENLNFPGYLEKLSRRRRSEPMRKLTAADVAAIRSSPDNCYALARSFNVSRAHISNIRAGRGWREACA